MPRKFEFKRGERRLIADALLSAAYGYESGWIPSGVLRGRKVVRYRTRDQMSAIAERLRAIALRVRSER